MFFSLKSSKERCITHRGRSLRIETLDKRELMDGCGIAPALPVTDPSGPQTSVQMGSFATPASSIQSAKPIVVEKSVVTQPSMVHATSPTSAPSISRQIPIGGFVSGNITSLNRFQDWTFQSTRINQIFQMRLVTNSRAGITVFDPTGRVVPTSADGLHQFKAHQMGKYTVRVGMVSSDTGWYHVGLESISPASPDSRVIRRGQAIKAGFNHRERPVEVHQYTLELRRGDHFQVRSNIDFARDSRIRLDVYTPSGKYLGPMGFDGSFRFQAPENGKYVIQLSRGHSPQPYVGRYRMEIR